MNSSALWIATMTIVGSVASIAAQAQCQPSDKVYIGKLTFSPEEEALYLQRYERALARRTKGELYDIQEAMVGAPNWKPLAAAKSTARTISDAALRAAADYAAVNNSHALVVWRSGKVEAEYYFGGDEHTTLVNSLSLAKPVTAIAIGRAIELGYIKSLDQPVADFVSEWRGDPRREKILVRHLLDMRSGFLRQSEVSDASDIMSRSFLHPRHAEIIIREYPVVDEPGTRYEYNNAASDMVPVLIERATARRYAEFVGTEIWQKIGAMGGSVWLDREGGAAHGGCCLFAPAKSYLRLAILLLNDGVWNRKRLLSKSYVAQMKTPSAENPHYGLGLWIAGRYTNRRGFANPDLTAYPKVLHSEPYLAGDLYMFDGNANQVVYIIPSQQLIILRTGDFPPRGKGVAEWDNALLPNTIMRGIFKDQRASAPQMP